MEEVTASNWTLGKFYSSYILAYRHQLAPLHEEDDHDQFAQLEEGHHPELDELEPFEEPFAGW